MRSTLYFNGIFLVILSAAMIPPMLADLYFGYTNWINFFLCMVITSFFGGCLLLGNMSPKFEITRRQAFVLTNTSWLSLSVFGAMPFFMSSLNMGAVNSLFESISGLTTTGATVMMDLDHTPAGILLWRGILQWIGGIMIILMALTILPFLKVGGMHIFRSELSTDDKAMPRTAERGKMILLIYFMLTLLCTISYMLAGMEVFDAMVHGMTTISTGGFSTSSQSFLHFNSVILEFIAICFMILGALPFVLYLGVIRGNKKLVLKDTQVRVFLGLLIASVFLIFLYLLKNTDMPHLSTLRYSVFNTVSIMTGTGYFNADYTKWGPFCNTLLLFLMVIGGCAGSTTGGIKIFRFQVLYSVTIGQIQRLVYPHSVFVPHFNGKPIQKDIPMSVMGFFFVYALCFLLLALGLSLTGLDFLTAFSAAISAVSNVGPGIGSIIGPTGTYQTLSDPAKLMLCGGMIVGRLELFVALVMLSPYFWRD